MGHSREDMTLLFGSLVACILAYVVIRPFLPFTLSRPQVSIEVGENSQMYFSKNPEVIISADNPFVLEGPDQEVRKSFLDGSEYKLWPERYKSGPWQIKSKGQVSLVINGHEESQQGFVEIYKDRRDAILDAILNFLFCSIIPLYVIGNYSRRPKEE